MSSDTQISAYVSTSTKDELERYAEEHGVKKGRLIEEALLHHFQALKEIPRDVVIPARIVLTTKSGEHVLERIRHPRKPTAAMKRLFAKRDE